MSKKFWRRSGKEQAAKCPICGKYMDKMRISLSREQATGDPIEWNDLFDAFVWCCHDCNEKGKA